MYITRLFFKWKHKQSCCPELYWLMLHQFHTVTRALQALHAAAKAITASLRVIVVAFLNEISSSTQKRSFSKGYGYIFIMCSYSGCVNFNYIYTYIYIVDVDERQLKDAKTLRNAKRKARQNAKDRYASGLTDSSKTLCQKMLKTLC